MKLLSAIDAPTLNFDIMDGIIFHAYGLTSASFMFRGASSPISNFIELRIHGRVLFVLDFGLREYCIFFDGISRQTKHFSISVRVFLNVSYSSFAHWIINSLQYLFPRHFNLALWCEKPTYQLILDFTWSLPKIKYFLHLN